MENSTNPTSNDDAPLFEILEGMACFYRDSGKWWQLLRGKFECGSHCRLMVAFSVLASP